MEKQQQHIVFLSPGFCENEQDSSCTPAIQDLLRAYTNQFPADVVEVVSFQYPFSKGKYVWNGINCYAAGGANRKGVFRFFTWLRVLFILREIHKKNSIDVIHCFWLTEASFIGSVAAWWLGNKQVCTIMGQDVKPGNRFISFIGKRSAIVAMSDFSANLLKQIYKKNVSKTIPLGVYIDSENKPSETKTIDILGVGSVVAVKNYSSFLKIVAEINATYPLKSVKIVGNLTEKEEFKKLQQLVKELHLEHILEFVNSVPREEVFTYYCSTKIMLHTSLHEGQSTAVNEALHFQIPVVCYDAGNTTGCIVCKSEDEMAEKCIQLLSNKIQHSDFKGFDIRESVMMYKKIYSGD